MKKRWIVSIVMIGVLSAANVHAQDTTTLGQDLKQVAKKTGKAIKKGAKKAGAKTAELASKGKAAIVDKIYEGKEGPDGATIYINKDSKYYWIDKKGHRVFVTEEELTDKES
ncbi:MAG: hypothetical protein ABJB11_10695 [Ferruginibacter sp.]